MRVMVDTSVAVAHHYPFEPGWEVAVASLVLAELEAACHTPGLAPEAKGRRLARLREAQRRFGPGLPFDDAAAASYGIITEYVFATGRQVRRRAVDLMIAAVAHSNGAALVTRDKDDLALEPIMDVRLVR